MKRRWAAGVAVVLVAVFAGVSWYYIHRISGQLWEGSLESVVERSRQEAAALSFQLENDYGAMRRIWAQARTQEQLLELEEAGLREILFYPWGSAPLSGIEARDPALAEFLAGSGQEEGAFPSHINQASGEEVFSLYLKGALEDGTQGYLVKEYSTQDISSRFTLSFYDNTGFSYLTDRDGNIMVRPAGQGGSEVSLFDMLSQEENEPQAIARMRENLAKGESGWARFWRREPAESVIFCSEPLAGGLDWALVSVVPEKKVMAQAESVLTQTLLFTGMAVLILLAMALVFYSSKLRENRRRTQEVEWALAAADKANRVKGRFLMDISHDIRTPLNAIVGMTAIARENLENPGKLGDCLEKIDISSAHLLTLISNMLDMSQIEQGKAILAREPVELAQLYREMINQMERRAQEAGLALSAEPARVADKCVWGDGQRIRQIMMNVIGNAIKYTPAGGSVTIELTQLPQEEGNQRVYRFRCADTGIGMEAEFVEKVFQPFERARNTTDSKIPGAGVGLSITKSLVDLMGGEIQAESELGKGSVFTVAIPLEVCREEPEAPEEVLPDEPPDYSGKRVLIVEDNELNMEILEELLDMTGVQTEKAYDGQEAVELVKSRPEGYYNLIFMDIQMPVMDGYSATRLIRSLDQGDGEKLPIYAVSANALAQDVANALEAGMNGHIAKPVNLEALGKVLKHCLT